ncbi:hypothetical protein P5G51_011370 [Virgibacillus sp. 179-BFC.A HS]|uniref:Uncharacterized protein n=1 Tax=Tigheibacillus jepli TaxID=3035914 RepID=A0ABU5CK55_9BACI|nr:hypothetical protein [Virgibacillus sp. 179-BFC.A HS]MDY0405908.1 hypothetical protein [Virgibacillus sp. 179-BFC.A HS]
MKKQEVTEIEQELESMEQSIYKNYQKYQEAISAAKDIKSQLDSVRSALAMYDQEELQYNQDNSKLDDRKKDCKMI